MAKLHADYKDGFSVTLDITLVFGHKCQLFIKVKHIQGRLRLEFRREPFCHWLLVFQDEPLIDFEVKSYFATVESPQLAQIITQQLRRAIKRKQTWPSYKVRFQPFFPTSKQPVPTEILTANGNNIIPGIFDILIKYCDRLSIPLAIYDKQKASSVSVFLTINTNEQMCADYLHINRDQWRKKEIELIRNVKIVVKEVNYMDRTELLLEELDPLPNGIEDIAAFKAALEEKNVFLLKVQGQDVTTVKQTNRLLKYKMTALPNDGTASATTTNANEDKIQIVVGLPLLHSVRVQRAVESLSTPEVEKPVQCLNYLFVFCLSIYYRVDTLQLCQHVVMDQLLQHLPLYGNELFQQQVCLNISFEINPQNSFSLVKFDKTASSVGLPSKQLDGEDEQSQIINTPDTPTKPQDTNVPKKPKYSVNKI